MEQKSANKYFSTVGDGSGLAQSEGLYKEELQLALRNSGMPLEALRYPITPTGLHYLLIHYDIPAVTADQWRLKIAGRVATPLNLTLEEIKKRPRRTIPVTMECAGNGRALFAPRRISQPWLLDAIGNAEWTGTPLRTVLQEAGIRGDAAEIVFTGLDQGVEGDQIQHYQRSLTVDEATRDEVLLVYEMNGAPLPPQHGYPLRLLKPGWYGMASVKWLDRIEAVAEPFQGYQMVRAYRYAQSAEDPGEAVNVMRARALMIPPGIPDFMTRERLVSAGPVTLTGKAWAGHGGVSRVELSVDGGSTWSKAELGESASPYARRTWTFVWDAKPGACVLHVRATDAEGNMQPVDQQWNYGGYGNNGVQRVNVVVR
ncbi:MAG: sulfite oxidase [Deltaproteobacteria bacterium]|nr:MAG: sulfite oxidase [Deltaproteobacteria bacterium]